ncbi:hypothetical protein HPB50_023031 [Hyalomma asiaticum]|uniref:Uncharacterized protein n=1 Tax=Hyalomma asiaticum TaxID=266040 RepID=A0ACB7SKL6_HYAAI|nr:hypothetical protein HPB50_023031 [Hyalomma asiaticum]
MASPSSPDEHGNVRAAKFGEYKFYVPLLPTYLNSLNTAYLHCDPQGRPYKLEDFVDEFDRLSMKERLKACGPYLRNHFWEVCFETPESRLKLLEARELRVKKRRCFVIDPQARYIHVILHWVPVDVKNRAVRHVLKRFGQVSRVSREPELTEQPQEVKWRTLLVSITLKSGLSADDVPHKVSFKKGAFSLVIVVGGTPTCLRCCQKGHLRRNCRAPRCDLCARVGHTDKQCNREKVIPAALAGEVAKPADQPGVETPAEAGHAGAESSERSAPATSESVAESQSDVMHVTFDEAAPETASKAEPLRDVFAGGDHVGAKDSLSEPAASESVADFQSEVMDVAHEEGTLGIGKKEEPVREVLAGGDVAAAQGSQSALAASESIAESLLEAMDVTYDEATPGPSSGAEPLPDVVAGGAEGPQSTPAACESSTEDAGSQSEGMDASGDEGEPGPSTKDKKPNPKTYLRKYKPKKKKKRRQKK